MGIEYLKSPARLLDRDQVNKGGLDLSTGDGNLSLPRIGNNEANKNGNYTPIAEIAREVQKVAEEIEAATGIPLTTTSSAGEVEETEEPALKKEKKEDDQNVIIYHQQIKTIYHSA